jgi:hypothetical protein
MMSIDYQKLFRAREATFAELLRLSTLQWDRIVTDDYDGLLDLLGAKQRLLGRLEDLATVFPTVVERWRGERGELEATVRGECDRLLSATESLLARLTEQERICSEELQRRRDETRGELCQVVGGRAAAGAYRQDETPVGARWLDVAE